MKQEDIEKKVTELRQIITNSAAKVFYGDEVIDYRTYGCVSEKTRQYVLERDNYCCQVCGSPFNLHIHHKIPRKWGGYHKEDNLITLCASCHITIEGTSDLKHTLKICYRNARRNDYE